MVSWWTVFYDGHNCTKATNWQWVFFIPCMIVGFQHLFLVTLNCLLLRIKIFHYDGSLYFKKMFNKLYQVSRNVLFILFPFQFFFSCSNINHWICMNYWCRLTGSLKLLKAFLILMSFWRLSTPWRLMIMKRKVT